MDDDGDNGELRVRSADGAAESKCDVFKKKRRKNADKSRVKSFFLFPGDSLILPFCPDSRSAYKMVPSRPCMAK